MAKPTQDGMPPDPKEMVTDEPRHPVVSSTEVEETVDCSDGKLEHPHVERQCSKKDRELMQQPLVPDSSNEE